MAANMNPVSGGSATQRDSDWFDFGQLLASMWRWRLVVLAVTMIGGAVGYGTSVNRTPQFAGVERVAILQSSGGGPAADAQARFEAILQSEAVATAAVEALPDRGLTVDAVRRSISSRFDATASQLIVQAVWSDAATAGDLTPAMARAALTILRAQAAEQRVAAQAKLKSDFEESERALEKARTALVEFRQTQSVDLARVELESLHARRRDFSEVSAEIPAERARLKNAQERLARTPPTLPREPVDVLPDVQTEIAVESARLRSLRERLSKTPQTLFLNRASDPAEAASPDSRQPGPGRIETPNTEYFSIAQQVATSEARLAGLEARRDHLAKNRNARSPVALPAEGDEFRVPANATRADFANPEYAIALQRVVTSEVLLAGLEGRREYLTGLGQGSARAELLREIAVFELRQTVVQNDLTRAQQLRDRLSDSYYQIQQQNSGPGALLELIERAPTPGVMLGAPPMVAVWRGVAMGLVLSVLAIVFLRGLTITPFRRAD